MFIFINAFLIGTASGLRALIGVAAVSWAAHFNILPLNHTWLTFLGYAFTPYILTLMAIAELVNDKLPKTPSRLVPPQFITRIVTSASVRSCDWASWPWNDHRAASGNYWSCGRNICLLRGDGGVLTHHWSPSSTRDTAEPFSIRTAARLPIFLSAISKSRSSPALSSENTRLI